MFRVKNFSVSQGRAGHMLFVVACVFSLVLLTGCISSSRVYNNDKTIVYNGTMYNMANVKQINSIITGTLAGDKDVNLKNANRKQVEAYLDQNSPMFVKMAFEFDDREMVYRANSVKKWSEYSKMKKSFEDAGNKISKLMSNKKQLQLKLK